MSAAVSARRWYAPTVLALLVLGGAIFALGRRTWVTTRLGDGKGAGALIETTGADIAPLVPALGVVIAAAALAVLASSGWFRRLVGALIVVVAVGGAVATRADPSGVVDAAVEESVAFGQDVSVAETTHHASWQAAALFVLAALLGALIVRYGPSWPTMSSRYDAPSARPEPTEADVWAAMDRGLDPTDRDDDDLIGDR
ncbi:MAG: Trp biosynthesis-associated membrane protein [Aeromicrobium sp.]|uniref:Trp biosynthesis-associated membrane protein n=1 Tax=Aeromicrobium sp. TaxID=1871063 RepID=UPI0039E4373D